MTRPVSSVICTPLLVLLFATAAWPQATAMRPFIVSAWVHSIPEPPGGGSWDSGIEGLLAGQLAGISPDIYVCVESATYGIRSCTPVCENKYECNQPLTSPPGGVPLESPNGTLSVWVLENSPRGDRVIAHYENVEPLACMEDSPCTQEKPEGTLSISFGSTLREVVVPRSAAPGDGAAPGSGAASPSGQAQVEPSYLDQATDWFRRRVWERIRDAAGFRGTAIEGMAEGSAVARQKYVSCLTGQVGLNQLTPQFNRCTLGDTTQTERCATQVLNENLPKAVASCQQRELQVGFLANLWRSACGIVGASCQ